MFQAKPNMHIRRLHAIGPIENMSSKNTEFKYPDKAKVIVVRDRSPSRKLSTQGEKAGMEGKGLSLVWDCIRDSGI